MPFVDGHQSAHCVKGITVQRKAAICFYAFCYGGAHMKLEVISKKPEHPSHQTPLLFIHGAWHGAWCWEKYFLPYFVKRGFDCYAMSLRGHGVSEKPLHSRWMRITDYVEDIKQVVDGLVQKPVLIGHSMGGLVVQKYLEENKAPAAVLLASVPLKGVFKTALRIARRHPIAFLKANLTWRLYPIIGTLERTREAFFSHDISSRRLHQYFSLMQDESYLAFLDMMFFSLPKPEHVSTNVLVLGAEKDTIFHVEEIEETAAAYNQTAEIFSGMAHDMMLEKGWQLVADRIIQWLEVQDPGEP